MSANDELNVELSRCREMKDTSSQQQARLKEENISLRERIGYLTTDLKNCQERLCQLQKIATMTFGAAKKAT
eukprot:3164254-Ditylum_brightwellii.AAC.1